MSDSTDIIYHQLCICTGGKPKVIEYISSKVYIVNCLTLGNISNLLQAFS